ncbi:hypothetical protein [Neptunitalea lumnitzerae]|uniref:Lipoprotein n=1 Tax=Neptunitalea lumnitzerae TaxID=2965509 RepID=A0ABQ5MGF5_9FLAO|nr:hypothetical protein [Neptunitalea sp. Y10]GLB48467.1 hypothetical protein Y10_08350 [Neptunitalea sp. Y10]
MKFLKPYLFLLITSTVFLVSCTNGKNEVTQQKQIPEELTATIQKLDNKVMGSLLSGEKGLLNPIVAADYKDIQNGIIDTLIRGVQYAGLQDDFKVFDRFYISNKELDTLVIKAQSGVNAFTLKNTNAYKEQVISLLLVTNDKDEYLVANEYAKVAGEWKLTRLRFGQYTVAGKTATQWYEEAKKNREKGYLVDAVNNLLLSSDVAYPIAGGTWEYTLAPEIKKFYTSTLREAAKKYRLPMELSTIESKPKIINISQKRVYEGYFPVIKYITTIDLEDTEQARLENDKIHAQIDSICKGITADKKYLFYTAINRSQGNLKPRKSHQFVKELTN